MHSQEDEELQLLLSLKKQKKREEAKSIWQRLHRMTPHTRHVAYTACAAADLSRVTDRLTPQT